MSTPRTTTRGLVLRHQYGVTGPNIYCESCGKRVGKADLGAIVWGTSLYKNGTRRRPVYLCKGEDNGFTNCLNSPAYKHKPWEELGAFLGHLLWNTGIRSLADYKGISQSSARRAGL